MKQTFKYFSVLIIGFIILSGCNKNDVSERTEIIDTLSGSTNESDILLTFLENSGNFINDSKIPTMVSVEDVFKNLKNYLIIDIRSKSAYINGHIEGAINVERSELFEYMKSKVTASNYDKIVFVCYTNQSASYVTMMFRLLGYGNAYSMKYGMSSCDRSTAEKKWWKNISSKYVSQLETQSNKKNKKSKKYPKIKTGETNAYKILESQVKRFLNKKFTVKTEEVFSNPDKYYIINYWPEDHYNTGHIPGAVQYTPKKSLVRMTHLSTLPLKKPIVVYCYTGQHAAFVTAYLNILGYDAYSLSYAANGFMHSKLISSGIGHAYDKSKHFNEYPLVKGEFPTNHKEASGNTLENEAIEDHTLVVPILKNNTEEEGGC